MIYASRYQMRTDVFASERRNLLDEAEKRLEAAAKTSLVRVGLPGWYGLLLNEMLEVFDLTVKMETSEYSPVITDMRNEFKREVAESMEKAKRSDNPQAQEQMIIRWAATASVNAAVEAATTADPDENVGVEWVTMDDASVRPSHKELHGAQVPTGQTFEVDGEELLYPGQPVGDPSAWINCRCVLRPAMLGGDDSFDGKGVDTFANASDPSEQGENPTAVIVALPREGDPIGDVASGDHPHTTLVYLGTAGPEGVLPEMEEVVKLIPSLMTDKVSGRATLGDDKADVLLLDANASSIIRKALLDKPVIDQLFKEADNQFPHWIPHTTIGYPESPALSDEMPEGVTYDRIAYWRGEEMHEMKFELEDESITASAEEPKVIHAEDEEFTQEMADALVEELGGQIPWHGVLAPEGVPSGDGRQFALEALTNRPLPLPLKYMQEDRQGHDGSVVVGRIDRIFRDGNLVKAEGVFDTSEMAYEAVRQLANGMFRSVSVDTDASTWTEVDGEGGQASTGLCTSARICSATLLAIGAYAEAYIALGPWEDQGEAVTAGADTYDTVPTKTKDGPGWITDPKPTKRITSYWVDGRGAAKIQWGAPNDFYRCEAQLRKYVKNPKWLAGLCANLHYRALGAWPGQASAMTVTASAEVEPLNLVASAAAPLSADYFRNPGLEAPTPVRVTEDGHIFGHVAAWGTCHIAFKDSCTTAPTSRSNYAYFKTGEVITDAGPVAVGQITMDGPHASLKASARAASAHYDQTCTAVADVTAGEDSHGIWISGKVRDDITPKQLHGLRAAALSGDWRRIQGGLEMVAALAVNVPGFPIPRASLAASGEGQTSLIAAQVVRPEHEVDAIPAIVAGAESDQGKLSAVIQARKIFNSIGADRARRAFQNKGD